MQFVISVCSCRPLRALVLLDQYRQKSRLFRSPVLLVPLGDDFRFVDSSEWDAQFTNYQKLFDYFDQHPELHIKVNAWDTREGAGHEEETQQWTMILFNSSVDTVRQHAEVINLKIFTDVWILWETKLWNANRLSQSIMIFNYQ